MVLLSLRHSDAFVIWPLFFSIAAVIILILAYFVYVEIKSRNHNKIAEKYNNIVNNFNNLKNTEQSTKELIRIIEKKNLTYSPLSLYFILDNDLVSENDEINKYFDIVININSLEKDYGYSLQGSNEITDEGIAFRLPKGLR